MLDVNRLRLLRELSHRGTIAAVAQALSFTPSAVSQQLSTLEREAGVALLARTGRRVTLTPAGQNLVRHTESVLEHLGRAEAELARVRAGLAGPVRIGSYPAAVRAVLPTALTVLARAHPLLEPQIIELDPTKVPAALRAGDVDMALVHEYDFVPSGSDPGLTSEALFTESLYLAALEHGTIADHRDSSWIVSPAGTMCRSSTERACQAAGFSPRVRHEIDDFATVMVLAALGQGVALVPHLGARCPPAGLTLTRLPMSRRTRIGYRAGSSGHPAVAAVASALREAIPADLG
jgi:DNA-binding transcriptional LysR family regulator